MEYLGLAERYWEDVTSFMADAVIPKYKGLLKGIVIDTEENAPSASDSDPCMDAIKRIVERAQNYPEEVIYL